MKTLKRNPVSFWLINIKMLSLFTSVHCSNLYVKNLHEVLRAIWKHSKICTIFYKMLEMKIPYSFGSFISGSVKIKTIVVGHSKELTLWQYFAILQWSISFSLSYSLPRRP